MLGNKPLVSIIIPTYNRSHLIGRAIMSVLNQSFQDFELIVVDDGSSDDTEARILDFQIQDKRIRYFRHNVNKGPAAARNTGIGLASGRYIAFQDSDDEWMADKLEKQVNILNKSSSDIGMVYTGFVRVFSHKKVYVPSARIKKKEGDLHHELVGGNFIGMPTVLIKKECFEKVGIFDEHLPSLEDWELFIRVSKYYKFICIDEPLVITYESEDSISRVKTSNVKALKTIIEKHYESFRKVPKVLARHYFVIGDHMCRAGQIFEGRQYLKSAFRLNPFASKYFFCYLLSLGGQGLYNQWMR